MSTYRRTWINWRERNRTGRDVYCDRMEHADQCPATCPVCWTQCDMPEGHLYAHQFEGKCEPARYAHEDFKASMERAIRRLNEGGGTVNG